MVDYAETADRLRTPANALSGLATLVANGYGTRKEILSILEGILEDLDDLMAEVDRSG